MRWWHREPRDKAFVPSEPVCSHDSFPWGSLIPLGTTTGVFILLVMTEGLYALARLQQAGMKSLAGSSTHPHWGLCAMKLSCPC